MPGAESQKRRRKVQLFCLALLLLLPGHTQYAAGPPQEFSRDGIKYEHFVAREVPWSIHVLRIDRTRHDFELTTTLGDGDRIGLNALTEQLRTLPKDLGRARAAINGDFYHLEHDTFPGDPRGLHILRGELISSPAPRECFWIDPAGEPHIGEVIPDFSVTWANGERTPFSLNEARTGREAILFTPAAGTSTRTRGGTELILERATKAKWLPLRPGDKLPARIREIRRSGNSRIEPGTMVLSISSRDADLSAEPGDVVIISTATRPDLKGVRIAVGGGPVTVHNSVAAPGRANKSLVRHPRSAIGWNKKEFFFVEVDGRQPRLSVGMTVPELARFMADLGCDEAMNLDGGGSSEMWLDGRIMNRPCFGYERDTATAIVVVQKSSAPKTPEPPSGKPVSSADPANPPAGSQLEQVASGTSRAVPQSPHSSR